MTTATSVPADEGARIATALVAAIRANAAELSRIDGAIGDGDHGVNMSKGFGLAADRLGSRAVSVSEALDIIGDTLLTDVGGSMGPLYGTFFEAMGAACAGVDRLDAVVVGRMLDAGADAVVEIGGAAVGDKTLVDVLVPAQNAFRTAAAGGADLAGALAAMTAAAERGRESTRDMVARVGRASRLGERSRGVLDAGATSCALILGTFADEVTAILKAGT
jgi:dihydroxyacetone kinase-like protein